MFSDVPFSTIGATLKLSTTLNIPLTTVLKGLPKEFAEFVQPPNEEEGLSVYTFALNEEYDDVDLYVSEDMCKDPYNFTVNNSINEIH